MDVSAMAAMWISLLALTLSAQQVHGGRQIRNSGKPLIVTTILEKPYLQNSTSGGTGNARYEGFIADLMEKIAAKKDLKYNLVPVADKKYGQNLPGKGWDGMIGELVKVRADLAAAPMTISDERKTVVSFTEPFMTVGTTVLIKKPEDGADPPFKKAKELANHPEIKFGLVKGGATENFFKKQQSGPYYEMHQKMQRNQDDLTETVEAGVNKVKSGDGKYAFIMEDITADYWIHRDCQLMKVDTLRSDNKYAFAVRKNNNDLLEKLNQAIRALKEDETIETLRQKWWKPDEGCSGAISWSSLPYHVITVLMAAILSKFIW